MFMMIKMCQGKFPYEVRGLVRGSRLVESIWKIHENFKCIISMNCSMHYKAVVDLQSCYT